MIREERSWVTVGRVKEKLGLQGSKVFLMTSPVLRKELGRPEKQWKAGKGCQTGHSLNRDWVSKKQDRPGARRTTLTGDTETSKNDSVIRWEGEVRQHQRTLDAKITIWNSVWPKGSAHKAASWGRQPGSAPPSGLFIQGRKPGQSYKSRKADPAWTRLWHSTTMLTSPGKS